MEDSREYPNQGRIYSLWMGSENDMQFGVDSDWRQITKRYLELNKNKSIYHKQFAGLGTPAKRLKCLATKPVLNLSCRTALFISGLTTFIKNLMRGRVAGECPNCA